MPNSAMVIAFPADVNFKPHIPHLPDSILEKTDYRPDERERGRWERQIRQLPEGRQMRLRKCGCFAVHVVKETTAGRMEALAPVSCMDKIACSYCAIRYHTEAAADRLAKLLTVCKSARCPLIIVEARTSLPDWIAGVKAEGCETAEARGRLCGAGEGCRACNTARPTHRVAIAVETAARGKLLDSWRRAAAGTGGVYTTRLEPKGDRIELVVTLLVPAVVFDVPRGTFGYFDVAATTQFQVTGWTVAVRTATTEAMIGREVFAAHLPTMEVLANRQGMLTQTELRTVVRADGLTITTKSGGVRRVQRTAWFGVLAGRNQAATLRALGIRRVEPDVECKQTIEDHYKILHRNADTITVQSTRTALIRQFPISWWRANGYVSLHGEPLTSPDGPVWGRTAPWVEALRMRREIIAGADGAGPRFEIKKRDGHQRALKDEWALCLNALHPARQHAWVGTAACAQDIAAAFARASA